MLVHNLPPSHVRISSTYRPENDCVFLLQGSALLKSRQVSNEPLALGDSKADTRNLDAKVQASSRESSKNSTSQDAQFSGLKTVSDS